MSLTFVSVLRIVAAVLFALAALGWDPPRAHGPGLVAAGLCLWVVSDIPGVG